jgi:putative endonuclease
MLYTVYVLYSASYDKIYIGYTSNLIERIKSHNLLASKGWTIKFRPWTVIYCEYFSTKSEAMKKEKELKTAKFRSWIRLKLKNEYVSTGFISA